MVRVHPRFANFSAQASDLCLAAAVALMLLPGLAPRAEMGADWNRTTDEALWSNRAGHAMVGFQGRLWVFGGSRIEGDQEVYLEDVWSSEDGVEWTLVTDAAPWKRSLHTAAVVHDDKIWVMSNNGVANEVWASADGYAWGLVRSGLPFAVRTDYALLSFAVGELDGLWVLGGSDGQNGLNEVWFSADGYQWVNRTIAAPWEKRWGHTAAVYNGKMWIMGGCTRTKRLNDVWSSADGANWTRATGAAAFSPRQWHASAAFGGRLWVLGGLADDRVEGGETLEDDVWNSLDGATWTTSTAVVGNGGATQNIIFPRAGWKPRYKHSVALFGGNKLWIAGGKIETVQNVYTGATYRRSTSDVWYTELPPADTFAEAMKIEGPRGRAIGSNAGATREISEPLHAGKVGGSSVWWVWTAPFDGPVSFDTLNSDFHPADLLTREADTLLGVYVGGRVDSLIQIAGNDDYYDGGKGQSAVTFNAVQNQIYHIAVDGYNRAEGEIILRWGPGSVPPPGTAATTYIVDYAAVPDETHFRTIQEAINVAVKDGDEVLVKPGRYLQAIYLKNNDITLRSTYARTSQTVTPFTPIVSETIIDGGAGRPGTPNAWACITLSSRITTSTMISGFTIANGLAIYGAGINGNNAYAIVDHCYFTNNKVERLGGAIWANHGVTQYNHFERNETWTGSGGAMSECNGVVTTNTFVNNVAQVWGGAIDTHTGPIQYNDFSYNIATVGGGGAVAFADGGIQHNLFHENSTNGYGGALADCWGYARFWSALVQSNSGGTSVSITGGVDKEVDGWVRHNIVPIQHNEFTGNWAQGNGGAMWRCRGWLTNNTFQQNAARNGGAIYEHGYGFISNNLLENNTATFLGGALAMCEGTSITNNQFLSNKAARGGAICGGGWEWWGRPSEGPSRFVPAVDLPSTQNPLTLTDSSFDAPGIAPVTGDYPTSPVLLVEETFNQGDVTPALHWNVYVSRNLFHKNKATLHGGALYEVRTTRELHTSPSGDRWYIGRAFIHDNVITSNTAEEGFGGALFRCSGVVWPEPNTTTIYPHMPCEIMRNKISYNEAGVDGGALYDCDIADIWNNIIIYNRAGRNGAGLAECGYPGNGLHGAAPTEPFGAQITTIWNNLIYRNATAELENYDPNDPDSVIDPLRFGGAGVFYCYSYGVNNVVWRNTIPKALTADRPGYPQLYPHRYLDPGNLLFNYGFNSIEGWTAGGNRNDAVEPRFLSEKFYGDPEDDFRLLPDSPLIDWGADLTTVSVGAGLDRAFVQQNATTTPPYSDARSNQVDIELRIRPIDGDGVPANPYEIGSILDPNAWQRLVDSYSDYDVGPFEYHRTPPILSGRILDVGGAPLRGVRVVASNSGAAATTAIDGYYRLTVPHGWTGSLSAPFQQLRIAGETINYRFSPSDYKFVDPLTLDRGNMNFEGQPLARPLNDNLARATAISGASGSVAGWNYDGTVEPAEPFHAGRPPVATVWWAWTPSMSAPATFSTLGTDFDSALAVYAFGTAGGGMTSVAQGVTQTGGARLYGSASFLAVANVTYYIAVGGYNVDSIGNILLSWNQQARSPKRWSTSFGYNSGWRLEEHLRTLADVTGDGRADVVGFGRTGVLVAASGVGRFDASSIWVLDYGQMQGWQLPAHIRYMEDVNNDGKDDIVGFGDKGVLLSHSTGSAFTAPVMSVRNFGYNDAWLPDRHPRLMGDVNGDGKPDIVGFGDKGVVVSLANASGTAFLDAQLWVRNFGFNNGWLADRHPRMLADVDGNGQADIVGFGDKGVFVSLSTGSTFTPASLFTKEFGFADGWRIARHPRMLGDVNGDGLMDVVGFGEKGVVAALSAGGAFLPARRWTKSFSASSGWEIGRHPRMVVEISGDNKADIVGFGDAGTYVGVSLGDSFSDSQLLFGDFGYDQFYRTGKHIRTTGNVAGQNLPNIVAFGEDGVYVHQ